MKKRKSAINVVSTNSGGCCAPTTASIETITSTDACCAQPTDGSSCCDKNESKAVNIQKTGCC